jgi:hypothetical protein
VHVVEHVPRLAKRARAAIASEAERFVSFREPDVAECGVQLVPLA